MILEEPGVLKLWYDTEMNHTEKNIGNIGNDPDYLEAERLRLLECVATIRASGAIAHAYCWLSESSELKGSRTYTYIKLITQKPGKKLTSTSLGKPGSDRHSHWRAAIERREAIDELEQQLKMLDALMERQNRASQLHAFLSMLC
jgi:hypothetical protein